MIFHGIVPSFLTATKPQNQPEIMKYPWKSPLHAVAHLNSSSIKGWAWTEQYV
jgi:hypothetical protein